MKGREVLNVVVRTNTSSGHRVVQPKRFIWTPLIIMAEVLRAFWHVGTSAHGFEHVQMVIDLELRTEYVEGPTR